MCVIINCFKNRPSLEVVEKCHRANSDGAGVAWLNREKGIAEYKKGFSDPKEFHEFIHNLPMPIVLHFRSASVGGKLPALTHPFVISKESPLDLEGSAPLLMVHNGTVHDWELLLCAANIEQPKDEPMSDSRAISMIADGNEKFLAKVKGNYVVIDGRGEKDNFRTYGDFKEGYSDDDKGMLFSNFLWRYKGSNNSHVTYNNYSHRHFAGMRGENWEDGEMGDCCNPKQEKKEEKKKEDTLSLAEKEEIFEKWWLNYQGVS